MIPRTFELHSPATVPEAISVLRKMKNSKVLAGGQSLVPLMKLRLASPSNLVDIGKIPGLSYVKKKKDRLLIGSMTTHHDVASSPVIDRRCKTLSEAAGHIGDRQVRNRGTIGGAICHADPAGDIPAAIVALDAELKVASPSKGRVVKSKDFYRDMFTTSLRQNEILTQVNV